MRRGKHLQIGAGSRSRSQARGEDAARRSRKRADGREALSFEIAGLTQADRNHCLAELPFEIDGEIVYAVNLYAAQREARA